MDFILTTSGKIQSCSLHVSGSKSETNRLLLLQALFPQIRLQNSSDSDDSQVMISALHGQENVIDVHHAGTAMRFLTAYFATVPGKEVILTGSERMKERPVKILADALTALGAKIDYTEKEGYPPLEISGREITKNEVSLQANVSSQYITALMLIGTKLKNGINITLEGEITSLPYILMTLELLKQIGVEAFINGNVINVHPADLDIKTIDIVVESDWSSVSYFYSVIALGNIGDNITLLSYKQNSLQGDSALVGIYSQLGVETVFKDDAIILKKVKHSEDALRLNLVNTPDIAQTIAVTCFGLGIGCHLTGLHTLKIKETDRLEALKTELSKLGANISVSNDSLILEATAVINHNIAIATYNDHRMAMAFAPLAVKVPIIIKDAGVVSKSYTAFWKHLEQVGIVVKTL